MQLEVAVEIQKAYSKLTSGQVPFTKKNMCAILAPLRDKYGLTDRQVLDKYIYGKRKDGGAE